MTARDSKAGDYGVPDALRPAQWSGGIADAETQATPKHYWSKYGQD